MAGKATTVAATGDVMALADRFVSALATYRETEHVFAPDAVFDVNVPTWRFQLEGPEAFFDWLRHHSPDGYGLRIERAMATATGFIVEIEGEYAPHGHEAYFRNLIQCEVRDGRVSEVLYYCTGDWDLETRRRWIADPPVLPRRSR